MNTWKGPAGVHQTRSQSPQAFFFTGWLPGEVSLYEVDLKLGTEKYIFSRDKETKKLKLLFSCSSTFLVIINFIIQLLKA